ncbi:SDR family NAD(P)-dependent oxidoreductase [Ferrovibrio sp.]|uniref:SDR family NAD(P)-dependent oxidoreductase n=1 Tax=Ferrovibrio sp. TaxID=1917215 RepID=UPI001B5562A2|nr:SDR family NAD(P)-dependent oxidoreductase [Ferrovibrio sp.]MBP7062868.1 SDR family oxidoreductase [Ferrovibrio sp.]
MGKLAGKSCVITGAAGSLGLAAARRLLAEGASLLLVDRDAEKLDAAERALAAPGQVAVCAADVADSGDCQAYLEAASERWGGIDVLFCNAGISGVIRPVTEYPEDVWDRVLAVNLRAAFLACKYGLPRLRDGGSIVMTASVVGVTSDPGICAYAASKHGLIGLMRTVAKEAAPRRIRVNVLAPGPIDNGFQRHVEAGLSQAIGQEAGAFLDGIIPLGRHGLPEEIAEAVLFLASDASSFTTGSVLMADGGMHI